MTAKKEWSTKRADYKFELAIEVLTGMPQGSDYTSKGNAVGHRSGSRSPAWPTKKRPAMSPSKAASCTCPTWRPDAALTACSWKTAGAACSRRSARKAPPISAIWKRARCRTNIARSACTTSGSPVRSSPTSCRSIHGSRKSCSCSSAASPQPPKSWPTTKGRSPVSGRARQSWSPS